MWVLSALLLGAAWLSGRAAFDAGWCAAGALFATLCLSWLASAVLGLVGAVRVTRVRRWG